MMGLLDFFGKYKDSLTAIGIILTLVVSAISLYFSVRNNKAVHYVNSVTKSRVEWIQDVRETVAEFISKTNVYNNAYYNDDVKMGEQLSQCQNLCSKIKLLLNGCDSRDKEICALVDAILQAHREYYDYTQNADVNELGYFIETKESKAYKDDIEKNISVLIKEVHIYLKAEWNRVKYESQGKTYEKETQEFDIQELERKYYDPRYKNNVWKRFGINFCAKAKRIFNSVGFASLLIGIALFTLVLQIIIA